MAISFVRSGGVTGTSFSFDIGSPGAQRMVIVTAADESSGSLSDVTVDGKSCTKVARAYNSNSLGSVSEMWFIQESGLGSSSGTVTISISGADSGWSLHAMLHTGVDQSGAVHDFGKDESSVSSTTVSPAGIDVPANGLVAAVWAEGQGGLTESGITSPLITRQDGPDPSSADAFTSEGVESSPQSNKSYRLTLSSSANRASAVVASWAEHMEAGNTHQMII